MDQKQPWIGIICWQVKKKNQIKKKKKKGQLKGVWGVVVEKQAYHIQVLTGSAGFLWLFMLPLIILNKIITR